MKRTILQKIICVTVACLFLINDLCFGLGIQPCSRQPEEQQEVFTEAQSRLAAGRETPIADVVDAMIPGFEGEDYLSQLKGVKFIRTDPDNIPNDWKDNFFFKNLDRVKTNGKVDLLKSLKFYLAHETKIPKEKLEVKLGYYKVDEKAGEIPFYQCEKVVDRAGVTKYVTIIVDVRFKERWEYILENDIWFEYTSPDGKKRTLSVAWELFFHPAKYEVADLIKGTPRDNDGVISEAILAWFAEAYCSNYRKQCSNVELLKSLESLFNGTKAQELKLSRYFQESLKSEENKQFTSKLACAINYQFFAKRRLKALNPTVDPGLIKQAEEREDARKATDVAATVNKITQVKKFIGDLRQELQAQDFGIFRTHAAGAILGLSDLEELLETDGALAVYNRLSELYDAFCALCARTYPEQNSVPAEQRTLEHIIDILMKGIEAFEAEFKTDINPSTVQVLTTERIKIINAIDELREEPEMVGGISAKQVAAKLGTQDVAAVEKELRILVEQGLLSLFSALLHEEEKKEKEDGFRSPALRFLMGEITEAESNALMKEHEKETREERFLFTPTELVKRPFSFGMAKMISCDDDRLKRFAVFLHLFLHDRINKSLSSSPQASVTFLSGYMEEADRAIAVSLNKKINEVRRMQPNELAKAFKSQDISQVNIETARDYIVKMDTHIGEIRDLIVQLKSWSDRTVLRAEDLNTPIEKQFKSVKTQFETGYAHFAFVYDVYRALAEEIRKSENESVIPASALPKMAETKVRVLFADDPANPETLGLIRQKLSEGFGSNVELVEDHGGGKDEEWLRKRIEVYEPDVIVVRSATNCFKDPNSSIFQFAKEHGVKAIIRAGAGVDNIAVDKTREHGISVARTHGNANSVADLTLFLLASLDKKMPGGKGPQSFSLPDIVIPSDEYLKLIRSKKWAGFSDDQKDEIINRWKQGIFDQLAGNEIATLARVLEGRTIGLLGFGSIAQTVARKLKLVRELTGISFTVLASSRSLVSDNPFAKELNVMPVSRAELFEKSDIISIHLPGIPGLAVTPAELKSKKLWALINTSRSQLADPGLLEQFVKERGIYLADLDMTGDLKKLIESNPENVIVFPHIGASTKDAGNGVEARTVSTLIQMVNLLLGRENPIGEPELEIVNGVKISPKQQTPIKVLPATPLAGESEQPRNADGTFSPKAGGSPCAALLIFAKNPEIFFKPEGFTSQEHERYASKVSERTRQRDRESLIKSEYLTMDKVGRYMLTHEGILAAFHHLYNEAHKENLGTVEVIDIKTGAAKRRFDERNTLNLMVGMEWPVAKDRSAKKGENVRVTYTPYGQEARAIYDKALKVAETIPGFREYLIQREERIGLYSKFNIGASFNDIMLNALYSFIFEVFEAISSNTAPTAPPADAASDDEFMIRSARMDELHSQSSTPRKIIGKTVRVQGEVLLDSVIVITGTAENLIAFMKAFVILKESHRNVNQIDATYSGFFSTIRWCDEHRSEKGKRFDDSQVDVSALDRFYVWVDDDGKPFLTYANNGDSPEIERLIVGFEIATGVENEPTASAKIKPWVGCYDRLSEPERNLIARLASTREEYPRNKALDLLAGVRLGIVDLRTLVRELRIHRATDTEMFMRLACSKLPMSAPAAPQAEQNPAGKEIVKYDWTDIDPNIKAMVEVDNPDLDERILIVLARAMVKRISKEIAITEIAQLLAGDCNKVLPKHTQLATTLVGAYPNRLAMAAPFRPWQWMKDHLTTKSAQDAGEYNHADDMALVERWLESNKHEDKLEIAKKLEGLLHRYENIGVAAIKALPQGYESQAYRDLKAQETQALNDLTELRDFVRHSPNGKVFFESEAWRRVDEWSRNYIEGLKSPVKTLKENKLVLCAPEEHHKSVLYMLRNAVIPEGKRVLILNFDAHNDGVAYKDKAVYRGLDAPQDGDWARWAEQEKLAYVIHMRSFFDDYDYNSHITADNWESPSRLQEVIARINEVRNDVCEVWVCIDYDSFSLIDSVATGYAWSKQELRQIYHFEHAEIERQLSHIQEFLREQNLKTARVVPVVSRDWLAHPEGAQQIRTGNGRASCGMRSDNPVKFQSYIDGITTLIERFAAKQDPELKREKRFYWDVYKDILNSSGPLCKADIIPGLKNDLASDRVTASGVAYRAANFTMSEEANVWHRGCPSSTVREFCCDLMWDMGEAVWDEFIKAMGTLGYSVERVEEPGKITKYNIQKQSGQMRNTVSDAGQNPTPKAATPEQAPEAVTPQAHKQDGTFDHKSGMKPEDALKVIMISPYLQNNAFTLKDYYDEYVAHLYFLRLTRPSKNWQNTFRADLNGLCKLGILKKDETRKQHIFEVAIPLSEEFKRIPERYETYRRKSDRTNNLRATSIIPGVTVSEETLRLLKDLASENNRIKYRLKKDIDQLATQIMTERRVKQVDTSAEPAAPAAPPVTDTTVATSSPISETTLPWVFLADDATSADQVAVAIREILGRKVITVDGKTLSQRKMSVPDSGYAEVVNTGDRALSGDRAYAQNRDLAVNFFSGTGSLPIIQIDSRLRGIGRSIRGIYEFLEFGSLLFVPAEPELGRLVKNGIYYHVENGQMVPFHQSTLANALEYPYKTSDLRDFLAGELGIPREKILSINEEIISKGPDAVVNFINGIQEKEKFIVIPDITTQADYEVVIAARQKLNRNNILTVGSRAFLRSLFTSYATQKAKPYQIYLSQAIDRHKRGAPLAVAASLESSMNRQIAYVQQALGPNLSTVVFDSRVVLEDEQRIQEEVSRAQEEVFQSLKAMKPVLLQTSRAQVFIGPEARQKLSEVISRIVASEKIQSQITALFVSGGQTGQTIKESLGISAVEIKGALQEDVPWGIPTEGPFKDMPIVTKGGRLGNEDVLFKFFEQGHPLPRANILSVVTPLTKDKEIDEAGIEKLITHLVSLGTTDIFVVGNAGEFRFLTNEKRIKAIEIFARKAKGKLRVFAGITSETPEETRKNYEVVSRLDVYAAVMMPLYFLKSSEEIAPFIESLRSIQPGLPVILYNNPERTNKQNISFEAVEAVGSPVIALKDSSGDPERFARYLKSLPVYQGQQRQFFEGYQQGARGAIGIIGHVSSLPNEFFGPATTESRREEIAKQINDLSKVVKQGGAEVAAYKFVLSLMGVMKDTVASNEPARDLTADQRRLIQENISKIGMTPSVTPVADTEEQAELLKLHAQNEEALKDYPLIKVISEYTVPTGAPAGPGVVKPVKLSVDDWKGLGFAIQFLRVSQVEIFMQQKIGVTQTMQDAISDVNVRNIAQAREKGETEEKKLIRYRLFSSKEGLMEDLKTPPAPGVLRIVINNEQFNNEDAEKRKGEIDDYIKSLGEGLSNFNNVRVLNILLPEGYENMSERNKTFHQARIIMIAILARLFEKDRDVMKMILQAMLKDYIKGDIEEFTNNLLKPEDSWTIAERLHYFLDKTVSLLERLVRDFELLKLRMKTFYIAA